MNQDAILKNNWERYKTHIDLDNKQIAKLLEPYSKQPIKSISLLSDGCANTNYKINFCTNEAPVVLRIYTRENSALDREVALSKYLQDKLPIPKILYSSTISTIDYPFAVIEWKNGQLLRDVVLQGDKNTIHACAFQAGRNLDLLRKITFDEGGFFQQGLNIRKFAPEERYQPFVQNMLQTPIVVKSLGKLYSSVVNWIKENLIFLPNEEQSNLTHGDFDPANMLVEQYNGEWRISALLDWEFAFSGTYLLDMGMFLRYAHKLNPVYQEGFISGIQADGFKLPSRWETQAKLMDMLCLLNLLQYNPIELRPNLNSDVFSLIEHTISNN